VLKDRGDPILLVCPCEDLAKEDSGAASELIVATTEPE